MSLKNSVGLVAKSVPGERYDYMSELHSSPYQRHMIAEINVAYQPALIVVDGVEAFVVGFFLFVRVGQVDYNSAQQQLSLPSRVLFPIQAFENATCSTHDCQL